VAARTHRFPALETQSSSARSQHRRGPGGRHAGALMARPERHILAGGVPRDAVALRRLAVGRPDRAGLHVRTPGALDHARSSAPRRPAPGHVRRAPGAGPVWTQRLRGRHHGFRAHGRPAPGRPGGRGPGTVHRVPAQPALQWLGLRSYSLYLWALPDEKLLDRLPVLGRASPLGAGVFFLSAGLLAEGSYRLVENRFRDHTLSTLPAV